MVTGIDCSKDYFDLVVLNDETIIFSARFDNNSQGFMQMLPTITGTHVSMEATGPYYFQLARFIAERGIRISVLNPLTVKRFSQMSLSRAKTDKKDALLIAKFTAMTKPKEWKVPADEITQIRNLETYIRGLKDRKHMIGNQKHAIEASGTVSIELSNEINDEIEYYQTKITAKEKQIEALINLNYKDLYQNLQTIPGIGPRSATLLITSTNGFNMFDGYRQIISYFGLAPRVYESGSSIRGKRKICKMGMSQIRKVLYMAATSAI
ncbi:IS110 family transposase [Sphingobacterium micropteri]|uniref:IS110 family transposase n=1 Tax=Sphingobacterium micropteri TaxID=2763501 RepID=UPI001CC2EFBC|nr:transposase [Sphingobacterium micropteri]